MDCFRGVAHVADLSQLAERGGPSEEAARSSLSCATWWWCRPARDPSTTWAPTRPPTSSIPRGDRPPERGAAQATTCCGGSPTGAPTPGPSRTAEGPCRCTRIRLRRGRAVGAVRRQDDHPPTGLRPGVRPGGRRPSPVARFHPDHDHGRPRRARLTAITPRLPHLMISSGWISPTGCGSGSSAASTLSS